MASAAITIIESPCTIESDTSEAVITKQKRTNGVVDGLDTLQGFLRNHGPSDVWCKVSVDIDTAAASVVTTGAQAQAQVPLPVGGILPWLKHYASVAHKTAAGTATLSWVPDHAARR